MSHLGTEDDLEGMPASFSPSVRRRRCSQVGWDVRRPEAAVLRSVPPVIRTMCTQKPASFPGIARDVLAPLQLAFHASAHGGNVPRAMHLRTADSVRPVEPMRGSTMHCHRSERETAIS